MCCGVTLCFRVFVQSIDVTFIILDVSWGLFWTNTPRQTASQLSLALSVSGTNCRVSSVAFQALPYTSMVFRKAQSNQHLCNWLSK